MSYHFNEIEKRWQDYWRDHQTFKAENNSDKPKYYVLDMFPYPSGAGLHVGHPLGYIASDIYASVTNAIKGLMYYILKAMTVLDCLPNSTPFKQVSTQRLLPKPISRPIVVNWIKSVFHSIGVGKCAPAIQHIINGPSGFLFNFSNRTIATIPMLHAQFQN